MLSLNRRHFLQTAAALGSVLVSVRIGRSAQAATARIDAPVVDRVVIREISDNSHNIFLGPLEDLGFTVQRTGFPAAAEARPSGRAEEVRSRACDVGALRRAELR